MLAESASFCKKRCGLQVISKTIASINYSPRLEASLYHYSLHQQMKTTNLLTIIGYTRRPTTRATRECEVHMLRAVCFIVLPPNLRSVTSMRMVKPIGDVRFTLDYVLRLAVLCYTSSDRT